MHLLDGRTSTPGVATEQRSALSGGRSTSAVVISKSDNSDNKERRPQPGQVDCRPSHGTELTERDE